MVPPQPAQGTCENRSTSRGNGKAPVDGVDGNWKCVSCGNVNFASRTKCNRCGAEKTWQQQQVQQVQQAQQQAESMLMALGQAPQQQQQVDAYGSADLTASDLQFQLPVLYEQIAQMQQRHMQLSLTVTSLQTQVQQLQTQLSQQAMQISLQQTPLQAAQITSASNIAEGGSAASEPGTAAAGSCLVLGKRYGDFNDDALLPPAYR